LHPWSPGKIGRTSRSWRARAFLPELTPRQHAVIAALLTERTHALAAKKPKVAEQIVRRWPATDPNFLNAYWSARRAVMDGVIGRLQQAGAAAVDALERNLTCEKPGDELRAAAAILVHAATGARSSGPLCHPDRSRGTN